MLQNHIRNTSHKRPRSMNRKWGKQERESDGSVKNYSIYINSCAWICMTLKKRRLRLFRDPVFGKFFVFFSFFVDSHCARNLEFFFLFHFSWVTVFVADSVCIFFIFLIREWRTTENALLWFEIICFFFCFVAFERLKLKLCTSYVSVSGIGMICCRFCLYSTTR